MFYTRCHQFYKLSSLYYMYHIPCFLNSVEYLTLHIIGTFHILGDVWNFHNVENTTQNIRGIRSLHILSVE
jgi:hypothetical protein